VILVVDASAVIPPLLAGRGPELLGHHKLLAPSLLWSEVSSVLHQLAWRHQVSNDVAKLGHKGLLELDCEERKGPQLRETAWDIADQLGWAKTYDAEYVALAQIAGVPLLTLDARLSRGAGRLVETLKPTDL
jgi:predicted nucleic acid-binding protein